MIYCVGRGGGMEKHNTPQTLTTSGTLHGLRNGCHRDQTSPAGVGLIKQDIKSITYECSSSTRNGSHKMENGPLIIIPYKD